MLNVSKDCDSGAINFGEHPLWDSFLHLEIMLILEEKANIEISEESMIYYGSLKKIKILLNEKDGLFFK